MGKQKGTSWGNIHIWICRAGWLSHSFTGRQKPEEIFTLYSTGERGSKPKFKIGLWEEACNVACNANANKYS